MDLLLQDRFIDIRYFFQLIYIVKIVINLQIAPHHRSWFQRDYVAQLTLYCKYILCIIVDSLRNKQIFTIFQIDQIPIR